MRNRGVLDVMVVSRLQFWRDGDRWFFLEAIFAGSLALFFWLSLSSGYPLGLWEIVAHSPTHSPNIRRNSTFIYSLSSFFSSKKIIQNWLTKTYHGILKPYYDVSQMIHGISASWICSSDSGLGFQSLGQVKGNGKCDPPLTWSWTMSQTMSHNLS